ncbi:hypothetical protein NKJ89_15670 [Mesorhizobium sp. M0047]
MIHSVPGDQAAVLLGPRATPEMPAQVHGEMGLDEPLIVQVAVSSTPVLTTTV